jgi:hypothetical protein
MRLLLSLVLFSATLAANPFLVSTGGTFSSTTPTTSFTAPSETWSLSFEVDSNPSVSGVVSGQQFNLPFSDLTYDLNGSPTTLNVGSITAFASSDFGLFTVCRDVVCTTDNVNPANGIYTEGAQIYSGSESSPTILTGVYPEFAPNAPMEFFVAGTEYDQTSGTVTISKVVSPVPEPSSLLALVACFGLIAWRPRRVNG